MAKLTLSSLTSSYRSNAALNANFDAIEAAIENTLSRDGTTPNAMAANFDMGSYRVVNLAAPVDDNDAIRKVDVDSGIGPDITTVADNITSVTTVATNIGDVTAVSADLAGADTIGDASALLAITAPGIIAKDTGGSPVSRTITGSTGISVSNGDGGAGNPTISLDAELVDIAGITPADGTFIVGDGSDFVGESGDTALTSLGGGTSGIAVFKGASAGAIRSTLSLVPGTDVLAYDTNLQAFVDVFTLPTTDGTSGQALTTDGLGVVSWVTPAGGGDTLKAADEVVTGQWKIWSTTSVDDLTALKALTTSEVSAGDTVYMRYRDSVGDRGAGMFHVFSGAASANEWLEGKATAGNSTGRPMVSDDGIVVENSAGNLTFVRVFDGEVNTAWYGASPSNSAADNTTAFNTCFNFARSRLYGLNNDEDSVSFFTPFGVYQINDLNFTQIRGTGGYWDLGGSTLEGVNTDGVMLDCLLSRNYTIKNGVLHGDATNTPRVGLQRGYSTNTTSSSYISLHNLYTRGSFSLTAIYNGGSEECYDTDSQWENQDSGSGSYCEIRDAMNWFGRRSSYVTGTRVATIVTGVTQASPGVVTSASHGLSNGDLVRFGDVGGMTELNGNLYTVANATTNTFELSGTNTSGFTAFTSGGYVWKTESYSYVNHTAVNVSHFKQNGGPAVALAGPGNQWSFINCYTYSPDSQGIDFIWNWDVTSSAPQNFTYEGQFERGVGAATDAIYINRLGTVTGDARVDGWRIKASVPQHSGAVIDTDAATNKVQIGGEIIIPDSAAPNVFGTASKFQFFGDFHTRDFGGLDLNVNAFSGEMRVYDPDQDALPAGAYRVVPYASNSSGSAVISKGAHEVRGGTGTIAAGAWDAEAYSRLEKDSLLLNRTATADQPSPTEGRIYYDDDDNVFYGRTNVAWVSLGVDTSADYTWTGTHQFNTEVTFVGIPVISNGSPYFILDETDQAADSRRLRFYQTGGVFQIQAINDNNSFKANILDCDRSGNFNVVGSYEVDGTKVVGNQGAAVADTSITYTTNDPSITPNDAVTIADGSAPTVSELLELCVELKNQIETLKGRLETHGLIST